uniref:alpha/beta fold hydrolase n=1 Tax=Sneathiella sp. TaxID=1964365 RepID=UPI00356A08BA
GLLTMALAGFAKDFIAGAVLNDVGPEIAASGGARILEYIGKDVRFNSLEDAVVAQKAASTAYPDLSEEDWMQQTANNFKFDAEAGNYKLNYDLNIAKALAEQLNTSEPVDLWPFFAKLNDIPTLAIRGGLSDVLSAEVFERMKAENPTMETLVLENRGHVPLLNEPEVLEKMDQFIARI